MKSQILGSLGLAVLAASLNAQSVSTVVSGLSAPNGVAVDSQNNYYIADGGGASVIWKYNSIDGTNVWAGQLGLAGVADGATADAQFSEPYGIVYVSSRGGLIVSDRGNHSIRFVSTATGAVTTVAGISNPSDTNADLVDGAGSAARFSSPSGLGVDPAGNVYIADFGNNAIRLLNAANTVSTVITGLSTPAAVACQDANTLWVADSKANKVYRYTKLAGVWTLSDTVGTGAAAYYNSSSQSKAKFWAPRGLAWIGGVTGLAVADTGNNMLRNIYGSSGAFGVGSLTNGFNEPLGLAIDGDFSIVVADSGNGAIKAYHRVAQQAMTVSQAGGLFNNDVKVVFGTTLTNNYEFHYTLDGTSPTILSPSAGSVTLTNDTVLLVRCFAPDYATSDVISNQYTFQVGVPVLSPSASSSSNAVIITVSETTTNAALYYTLDGSEPTTNSALISGGAFALDQTNLAVKVKGFRAGYAASATASGAFAFVVADPVASIPGQAISNVISLVLSTATTNTTLHWTTNGSTWNTAAGPATSVTISQSCSLVAYATRVGFTDSHFVTNTYTAGIAPVVITPSPVSLDRPTNITITCSTTNASLVIRYTTNGAAPTATVGFLATNGVSFPFSQTCTLKAAAFLPGFADSQETDASMVFQTGEPIISASATISANPIWVVVTSSTPNARIWWAFGTNTPTENPALFTQATNGVGFYVYTNGQLTVKAFADTGMNDSVVRSLFFTLKAGAPSFTAPTWSSNDVIPVVVSSATTNSAIYWTIDGSTPTTASASATNGGTILLTNSVLSGSLNAIAYFTNAGGVVDGFVSSDLATHAFTLKVSAAQISPASLTGIEAPLATFSGASAGADYYYSFNNTAPATNDTKYTAPFLVTTNGTLYARGFRSGFSPSDITPAVYNLSVGALTLALSSADNSNTVTVTSAGTSNAVIAVIVTPASGVAVTNLFTNNVSPTPYKVTNTINATVSATGTFAGFTASVATPVSSQVQVDAPRMSPNSGYFPSGVYVTLTSQRSDAVIYYSTDGTTPTTNSLVYDKSSARGFFVSGVSNPKKDLHTVKAFAVAPNTLASAVVSGQSFTNNLVAIPSGITNGAGATLVLPVVINLTSNQTLRSVQFRIEITPSSAGATFISTPLEALTLSNNDYIVVAGNNTVDNYSANYTAVAYTNAGNISGIYFYSIATNLNITDFGVLANIKVKLPSDATNGPGTNGPVTYSVVITNISGTSDASQAGVSFPANNFTITVDSVYSYVAGDCSPGKWYNAGGFGDQVLDNSDVNMAFLASAGIQVPYAFSDAFNAMDVYPETLPNTPAAQASGVGGVIGDGLITYLDWQHILLRSLGVETNMWERMWTNGTLHHWRITNTNLTHGVASVKIADSAQAKAQTDVSTNESVDVWLRHALIWGDILTNVNPGEAYSMPIYAKVLPNFEINGLQIRVKMTAVGSAPAVSNVDFTATDVVGTPTTSYQAKSNDVAYAWSLGRGTDPLTASNLIGYVNFTVPDSATKGQHYTVQLLYVQGATDYDTERSLESAAGQVWVLSSPSKPVLHIISDQWITNFFGSLNNTNADPDADPDHDGIPNWMEYLAGTNPTNADSTLGFSYVEPPQTSKPGVTLHWAAMTGRVYVLESKAALIGGDWTAISTNILGDGTMRAFTHSNTVDQSRFYRIRLIAE